MFKSIGTLNIISSHGLPVMSIFPLEGLLVM